MPRAQYNVERIVADMALRGWNAVDLARASDCSSMTVRRFLSGQSQTAKMLHRLAKGLGYSPKRYLAGVEKVA